MDVLVVDDEVAFREHIADTLRAEGYRVTTSGNGREALELLQRERQQLVVSDWKMPGLSGLELCHAIRQSSLRRYVYFILLTGRDGPQDTVDGLSAGADDYVTKPFRPRELVLRVNTGRRIILVESREMVIFTLAKLAESRDPDTGSHLERVRGYSQVLTRHLQQTPEFQGTIHDEFVRLVYETSPLHDIGKVAIPDSILLNKGRLTEDEFEIMKTHTTGAAKILAAAVDQFPNADFLTMAHDIALSHHERYDGSGYPHGLTGDQIPLCGRIVALADVYDALTSRRMYKEAMSHEDAKSLIVSERGRQFDPVIVERFLEIEDQFHSIRTRHRGDQLGASQTVSNPAMHAMDLHHAG